MTFIRKSVRTGILQDEQLINAVFKLHFNSLYNYGLKITNKKDLVEDSIQEIFFRIWKNSIDLNAVSNCKSYLFRALRRQLFNLLELKDEQNISFEGSTNESIEFSPEDFVIHNQTEEENRKSVINALNRLPERQREAIYLRYFEDLNFNEIAVIMNINTQSAKNSVFKGLRTLRKMFPGLILLNYLNECLRLFEV